MIYDPRWADAISSIESSGNYGALGPTTRNGDRAYGKYQVMGANVPEWTNSALGYAMTPDEYLKDEGAQDAVFKHRFGGYAEKYGNPQDAASAWFTGGPRSQTANRSDILGTTGQNYVSKFNNALSGSSMDDDEETPGALSTKATVGPGVLVPGAGRGSTPGAGLENGLYGAAAALASIYSPQQGAVLAGLRKDPADAGFTLHVDPKSGVGLRMSKNGQITKFQAFAPQAENKGEDAYAVARAKSNSDLTDQIDADASASQSSLGDIATARQALGPNGGVYQGSGGERVADVKKLAQSLGIPVEGVSNADLANATANRVALQAGTKMKGSFSDKDVLFLKSQNFNLNNTPEANAVILDNLQKAHERIVFVQQKRDEYVAKHGKVDDSFRTEMSKFARDNPLFASNSAVTSTVVPTAAPGGAQRPPLSSIFK